MAERSNSGRTLAYILVGLGAFLIVGALMLPTYTVSQLAKTPLDLEITTVATTPDEGGEVLNSATLTSGPGRAQVDKGVPMVSQRFLTVEEPSDADKMTIQAGTTLRRTDKQGDTGLLTASVDRVTVDRKTGMPVEDPVGSIQIEGTKPAEEVAHDGLQYRFPFDTEQKTYPYFDINARDSFDIDFVEETEINGQKVYHFHQKIDPVDLSKVVASPTNKLTLPAAKWGVVGGSTPVTMTRWYSNERDLWIEPVTGVIVKGQEKPVQFYARSGDKPELTVLNTNLTFDENTVESQLEKAKDGIDKISLFGRILPIVFGILGVIALVIGIVLGVRRGKGPKDPAETGGPTDPADSTATTPEPGHDWTTDRTEEIPVHRDDRI
jgi:Porin PorA